MRKPETLHSDKHKNDGIDQQDFGPDCPDLENARQEGLDLWALWANLHRTPQERMERHQVALDLYHKLSKAKTL